MENINVIGTSHVAKQSLKEVKAAILTDKPDILALELDQNRFHALLNEEKGSKRVPISQIGVKGFLFFVFGAWIQRKIGKTLGVMPGSEMKLAINLARKHNIKIALVDRDIRITLKRFSQSIGWRERLNFVKDLIKGLIFRKKELNKMGLANIDLSKVPNEELIEKLILKIKDRYPGTYSALVEERNLVMANNILSIAAQEPDKKILVIVGAGHKKGIQEELQKANMDELAVAG